jgi:hypothetical protein
LNSFHLDSRYDKTLPWTLFRLYSSDPFLFVFHIFPDVLRQDPSLELPFHPPGGTLHIFVYAARLKQVRNPRGRISRVDCFRSLSRLSRSLACVASSIKKEPFDRSFDFNPAAADPLAAELLSGNVEEAEEAEARVVARCETPPPLLIEPQL